MGFSPGDFTIMTPTGNSDVHWEAKDRYLVLWDEFESRQILRLTYDEAIKALTQLRTAIACATGEDPI